MKKAATILLAFCVFLFVAGTATAALIDRGGGLIYCDDLNITWLQDSNYARSRMTWSEAMAWAESLEYYDSVRGVTWDDWRLPTTPGTESGYVNEGEMGHLYYDEGVTCFLPGPFLNVQCYDIYWSDTEDADDPRYAWVFNFGLGIQGTAKKDRSHYAWAVRPGNVPIPGAVWLLGSGLVGFIGIRRRKLKVKEVMPGR